MRRLGPIDSERREEDALLTTAALANEEAQLRALGPSAPLPEAQVNALVAAALAVSARPLLVRRMLLAAGLFLVALAPLGWIGAKIVWPERELAPLNMSFAEAIDVATNPVYNDAGHAVAVSIIDENCGYAAQVLRSLTSSATDPSIAAEAAAQRALIRSWFDSPLQQTLRTQSLEMTAIAALAIDEARPSAERIKAIRELTSSVGVGLTAMRVSHATVIRDPEVEKKTASWLQRLRTDFSDP